MAKILRLSIRQTLKNNKGYNKIQVVLIQGGLCFLD
jgi:hypothetical protein